MLFLACAVEGVSGTRKGVFTVLLLSLCEFGFGLLLFAVIFWLNTILVGFVATTNYELFNNNNNNWLVPIRVRSIAKLPLFLARLEFGFHVLIDELIGG